MAKDLYAEFTRVEKEKSDRDKTAVDFKERTSERVRSLMTQADLALARGDRLGAQVLRSKAAQAQSRLG